MNAEQQRAQQRRRSHGEGVNPGREVRRTTRNTCCSRIGRAAKRTNVSRGESRPVTRTGLIHFCFPDCPILFKCPRSAPAPSYSILWIILLLSLSLVGVPKRSTSFPLILSFSSVFNNASITFVEMKFFAASPRRGNGDSFYWERRTVSGWNGSNTSRGSTICSHSFGLFVRRGLARARR